MVDCCYWKYKTTNMLPYAYTDLAPQTTIDNLVGGAVKMQKVEITIPAQNKDATIFYAYSSSLTEDLSNAPFDVYLRSGDLSDYNAIDCIESTTQNGNQGVLVSTYSGAIKNPISLDLIFYQKVNG